VTKAESQNSTKLIGAVRDAKKQGVYDQSKFSKFENHRRTIYIHLTEASGETERTVIISQNRPCHLAGDEPMPVNVTDQSIWKKMLPEPKFEDGEDFEILGTDFGVLRALKKVLAGIVAGVLETWNMEIAELDDQFEALEARIYGNPSDDTPAADLWSLSKHLLGVQQSMEAHVDMMKSMEDTLNRYTSECRNQLSDQEAKEQGKFWNFESKSPWLQPYVEEMADLAKNIEDDHIKYANQMIDLVSKSVLGTATAVFANDQKAVQIRQH
jgi:hypothetical protein